MARIACRGHKYVVSTAYPPPRCILHFVDHPLFRDLPNAKKGLNLTKSSKLSILNGLSVPLPLTRPLNPMTLSELYSAISNLLGLEATEFQLLSYDYCEH